MFTWFLQPWNIFNCEFFIFSDGGRKGYGYGPDGKDDINRAGRKGSSDDVLGAGDANSRKGSGYDGNNPYGRKDFGYDPNDPNSRKGSRFDPNNR